MDYSNVLPVDPAAVPDYPELDPAWISSWKSAHEMKELLRVHVCLRVVRAGAVGAAIKWIPRFSDHCPNSCGQCVIEVRRQAELLFVDALPYLHRLALQRQRGLHRERLV